MTFWETLESGEFVMIALAVILIAVIVIWWIKTVSLSHSRIKNLPLLLERIKDYINEGDIDNTIGICLMTSTPGGRVMADGLLKLGAPIEEIEERMQKSAVNKKITLASGMIWLKYIAVASPLIGLGGTLAGICHRLNGIIELDGVADCGIIAEAVAPAIVTTVAGIGVGIVAIVALATLESYIACIGRNIDLAIEQLTKLLSEPSVK